jgi:CheY-like chemotaxis protein
MPEMNGWEVAARVKELSPSTPVVLLTGWPEDIQPERLGELGLAAVLNKPCRLSQLRQVISTVTNTIEAPAPPKTVEAGIPVRDTSALRILVVDDNRLLGDSLRELLAMDGHEVTLARSTREGLELIGKGQFDMVLADLRMPDGAGTDISSALTSGNRPFMVIMTGDTHAEQMVSVEVGVDMLLHKPWTAAEWQAVEQAARAHRDIRRD